MVYALNVFPRIFRYYYYFLLIPSKLRFNLPLPPKKKLHLILTSCETNLSVKERYYFLLCLFEVYFYVSEKKTIYMICHDISKVIKCYYSEK